jgi:hypothetical protein
VTCGRWWFGGVAAEAVCEERECGFAVGADVAGEVGEAVLAGEDALADVGEEGTVDADQGVGRDPGPGVVAAGAGLLSDRAGQGVGVAGQDLCFAGQQGGTAGDQPGDAPELFGGAGVRGGQQAAWLEDEAAESGEDGLAGGAFADRLQQCVLEGLHAAVDQVFLGREVVEHGRLRDLGRPGDLGDADLLEAPLGEQPPSGPLEQLPCLLLFRSRNPGPTLIPRC